MCVIISLVLGISIHSPMVIKIISQHLHNVNMGTLKKLPADIACRKLLICQSLKLFLFIVGFDLLRYHGPDTFIGEDFEKYAVRDAPVYNMGSSHTLFKRAYTAQHFRDHAAYNNSLINQPVNLFTGNGMQNGTLIF